MVKDFRFYLFGILLLAVFSFPVAGQDLGSSNGLFRAANPKSKNASAEKKDDSKPKTTNQHRKKRPREKTLRAAIRGKRLNRKEPKQ